MSVSPPSGPPKGSGGPGTVEGMTDRPGPDDEQPNPFKGTPFEQLFRQLGQQFGQGGQGGQGPGGQPGIPDLSAFGLGGSGGGLDFSALLGQVQAMMQPHDGSVNWKLATDVARRAVGATPDPAVGAAEERRIAEALRLADHWLDDVTDFPSGVSTSGGWSRAEWIEQTVPTWQQLVEPVAQHVVSAMADALPGEAKAMAGPLIGMLGQAGGAIFGSQIGQALGELATEVLTATDIGLPLAPVGRAALLPANVAEFAEGLDVPDEDVVLYVALREAAHQRLYAHVPWLRAHVVGAIEDYGRGMRIDMSRIETQIQEIDPTNPQSLQEAMSSGLFEPQKTPAQEAALVRLETILALVEGWVDEVVSQACESRLPSAARLREIVRRRRAAGGPAEDTFVALVGLELRPRRLRDAAALWGNLRARHDAARRDAAWAHPDLMPDAADLDDPLGFAERRTPGDAADEAGELIGEDFDARLAQLLDQGVSDSLSEPADEQTDGPTDGDSDDGEAGTSSR
jgi:putative hydrolase